MATSREVVADALTIEALRKTVMADLGATYQRGRAAAQGMPGDWFDRVFREAMATFTAPVAVTTGFEPRIALGVYRCGGGHQCGCHSFFNQNSSRAQVSGRTPE